MSIGLALRAFFAVLFRAEVADRVREALQSKQSGKGGAGLKGGAESQGKSTSEAPATGRTQPVGSHAKRSDALTLLSTLQREARFLDLVGEPLETFEDAQIGAAAREVMRDCRKALDRMFGIEPLSSGVEGASCALPKEPSAVRYRIVGKVANSPTSGVVVHRGWKAARCQLPTWTGSEDDGSILAPMEIEV